MNAPRKLPADKQGAVNIEAVIAITGSQNSNCITSAAIAKHKVNHPLGQHAGGGHALCRHHSREGDAVNAESDLRRARYEAPDVFAIYQQSIQAK